VDLECNMVNDLEQEELDDQQRSEERMSVEIVQKGEEVERQVSNARTLGDKIASVARHRDMTVVIPSMSK